MIQSRRNATGAGFTLVEVLIVVIILGVLAAIVIPQFAPASMETRKAALVDQLHTLRAQIHLFTLQHGDTPPDLSDGTWAPLITQTTFRGKTCGPYLQPSVPRNPLNNFSGVVVVGSDPDFGDPVAGAEIGFVYNPNTGVIWGTNRAGNRVYDEGWPDNPQNK